MYYLAQNCVTISWKVAQVVRHSIAAETMEEFLCPKVVITQGFWVDLITTATRTSSGLTEFGFVYKYTVSKMEMFGVGASNRYRTLLPPAGPPWSPVTSLFSKFMLDLRITKPTQWTHSSSSVVVMILTTVWLCHLCPLSFICKVNGSFLSLLRNKQPLEFKQLPRCM